MNDLLLPAAAAAAAAVPAAAPAAAQLHDFLVMPSTFSVMVGFSA